VSSLVRAGRRIRTTLTKQVDPGIARVIPMGSSIAKLFAETEVDLDGIRQTVPKMGEQVTSGIWKRQERISPENLERAYRMDELVFGIINKYITVMLGTGFVISASSSQVQKYMEDWCRKTQINNIFREVIRDLFVFGFAFVEKVYNKEGTKLVRLATVDSKTLDFERDANGNIQMDNYGLPKGFEQVLNLWLERDKISTEPNDAFGKREIKVPRERIAFFRFFTTSGAVIGISPLEVLYNIITWRKNVDWAMGEGAFTYAAPPIIINVGSPDLPTPQDMIDNISKDITEVGSQSVFVFPWHVKVNRLESSKGMDELANFSDTFKIAICNALMIPPALMGVGGRVSSARALGNITEEWERTVQGLQAMLSEQIEEQVFYSIAKEQEWEEVPRIEWKTMSPSVALSRARRRASYFRAGALSWDVTAENQIRKEEGLPLLPKDWQPPDKGDIESKIMSTVEDYLERKQEEEEEEESDVEPEETG